MSSLYRVNIEKEIFRSFNGYFFPNLTLSDRKVFDAIADDYENLIMQIEDADERNYLMAINKKRRAMFSHKYAFDRGLDPDQAQLEEQLELALTYFRNTSETFLNEEVPVTIPYYGEGVRSRSYKRRELFIYPDYFEGWFSNTFHSDLFFKFIDNNDLFEEFYRSPDELEMIHFWLAKAFEVKPLIDYLRFENVYPLPDEVLTRIIGLMNEHPAGRSFDLNLPRLVMANRSFENGDIQSGLAFYEQFDKRNLQLSRDRYEYIESTFFMNQMKDLVVNLALNGYHEEAVEFAELFERDHEKAYAYTFTAEKLYMEQLNPFSFVYLDSALANAGRIDFSQFDIGANNQIDIRYNLILLLSRIGGRELNAISNEFLREMLEGNKYQGLAARIYGVAEEGNFYRAMTAMPPILTETQELSLINVMLWQAAIKKESDEERQQRYSMDRFYTYDYNYVFYLPN